MKKSLTGISIAAAVFSSFAFSGSIDIKMATSSDSGVSNQDQITNIYDPEFVGKASQNSDVKISFNGSEFTTTTDSTGIFKWQSSPLQDGQYELIAESDNGSLVSSRFTIDTFTFLTAGYTNEQHSTRISGRAESANQVTLSTFSGLAYNTYADASGNWVIDIPKGKLDAQDFIQVDTTDIAGNLESTSFSYNDEPIEDHHLDVQLSASSDSGVLHDGITNFNRNIQFNGATTPSSSVTLIINGLEFESTASESGLWSITAPITLGDGQYGWEVKSESERGDLEFRHGSITIDTSAPQIDLNSDPIVNGYLEVAITGAVSEAAKVELFLDGSTYMTYAQFEWSFNVGKLAEGQYQFRVVATDVAGNQQIEQSEIIVIK